MFLLIFLFDDFLEFGLFLLYPVRDFLDQRTDHWCKDEDPVHSDTKDYLADNDESDQ